MMTRERDEYEQPPDREDHTTNRDRIRRRCPRPDKLTFNTAEAAGEWAGPALGLALWVYRCPCRAGHWHLTSWPTAQRARR